MASFKKVHLGGNIRAELIHSASPGVEITMLDGDPDELSVDVLGDELDIRFKDRHFWEYFTKSGARIKIYYTQLQRVDVSAGSKLMGTEIIQALQFDIEVSSGARCDLQLQCQEVRVDASSGSEVILSGKAKDLVFDLSSGASLEAYDFVVSQATGDASSGAEIRVNCTDLIDAEASSGAEVRFRGNPCTVHRNTSSGGSVRAL